MKGYADRQLVERIRHCTALGQVLGAICAVYGAYGYFAGMDHSDGFYITFWVLGSALLLAAIAYPLCLDSATRAVRNLTGKIGHFIFNALLTILYYLVLTPIGRLTGKASPALPFAAWDSPEKAVSYGWRDKTTRTLVQESGEAHIGNIFYQILRYFVQHGRWFLIPLIIVLLFLGLILFFAQTSVLAPFIYTLF
jgi:hypothetical protein